MTLHESIFIDLSCVKCTFPISLMIVKVEVKVDHMIMNVLSVVVWVAIFSQFCEVDVHSGMCDRQKVFRKKRKKKLMAYFPMQCEIND